MKWQEFIVTISVYLKATIVLINEQEKAAQ